MTPEERAVIDAAYDWRHATVIDDPIASRLADAVDALEGAQPPASDELVWVARTLADVRAGDTVRMPGRADTQARVVCAEPFDWHVQSGGDGPKAHWNDAPLEHRMINVRLDFKDGPRDHQGQPILRDMPATTPIEIRLSAEELRAIELLGWDNRLYVYQAS